ncbi:SCO family protein [Minwuia thermotolerans]|uniref:SCO family protein n=1 Tax=Minwuia thermotolerans TaxID=2056226 RepID=UPI000D6DC4D6|nr:SCO family protein [Minwuia thermotolerans]
MSKARWLSAVFLPVLLAAGASGAAQTQRDMQARIGFDQKIGATVPADIAFRDRHGERARLGDVLDGKPAVLVMGWYSCANICPVIFRNLGDALRKVAFAPGEDYRLITLSIDPGDGPDEARRALADLAGAGNAPPAHLLVGRESEISALSDAVGFRFVHDAERDTYGHPAGLILIDGQGRVNRYLVGMEFQSEDIELALLEAGRGELGSVADRLALRCFTFDPETGRYSLAVTNILRTAGLGSAVLLGAGLVLLLVRERRARRRREEGA